jgi:hypothetical protein
MDGRLADRGRKGRGTGAQPAHRFTDERRERVDDGWESLAEEAAAPPTRTAVAVDRTKRALSYNQSPDVPFDRAINPYRGCEHGCIYCYARPSHGTFGLSPGLDFETRLFVKPDVVQRLRVELAAPGYRVAPVYLSGVTDCYQPLEREHRLTRGLLEVLLETRHPVGIVTKSALVTRDLDLLVPLAEFSKSRSRSAERDPRARRCTSRDARRRRSRLAKNGRSAGTIRLDRQPRHRAGGEEVHPDGRRDHAHGEVDHHDQAEMHRVDAEGDGDRHQDRGQDQDGRRGLDEHADDEQEEVDGEEEGELRGEGRLHPVRRHRRQAGAGERNEKSEAAAMISMTTAVAMAVSRSTPTRLGMVSSR